MTPPPNSVDFNEVVEIPIGLSHPAAKSSRYRLMVCTSPRLTRPKNTTSGGSNNLVIGGKNFITKTRNARQPIEQIIFCFTVNLSIISLIVIYPIPCVVGADRRCSVFTLCVQCFELHMNIQKSLHYVNEVVFRF
jgi:hypothetical protein